MASFSSTLLDSIYRSIDGQQDITTVRGGAADVEDDLASFRRSCMIEKWMDKKSTILRCKSMADFDRNPRNVRDHRHRQQPVLLDSSSSSSDSSSGGFSSESDTVKSTSKRPKPIRTTLDHGGGGGLVKKTNNKSRASRIYADLKKARQLQPVSPGGRLASFLNSVFKKHGKIGSDSNLGCSDQKPRTKSSINKPGSNKKLGSDNKLGCSDQKPRTKSSSNKLCSDNNLGCSDLKPRTSKSNNNNNTTTTASSTCSSASSFSRSCLSKTPSSSNGKRSVRFVDQEELLITEELRSFKRDLEEKRRVHEAAMDLLKNYRQNQTDILNFHDEDGDDDASCASSDLFELDNLSVIGIDRRYDEELPVYETTHLGKNRAIANGFVI